MSLSGGLGPGRSTQVPHSLCHPGHPGGTVSLHRGSEVREPRPLLCLPGCGRAAGVTSVEELRATWGRHSAQAGGAHRRGRLPPLVGVTSFARTRPRWALLGPGSSGQCGSPLHLQDMGVLPCGFEHAFAPPGVQPSPERRLCLPDRFLLLLGPPPSAWLGAPLCWWGPRRLT